MSYAQRPRTGKLEAVQARAGELDQSLKDTKTREENLRCGPRERFCARPRSGRAPFIQNPRSQMRLVSVCLSHDFGIFMHG